MSNQIQSIKRSSISNIIEVKAVNSSGKGVTGILFGSVSVRAWEVGKANLVTTIVTISGTIGTYISNGWVEVDAVNLPGVYQYSVPNTILGSSSNLINLNFVFAVGIFDSFYQIQLTAADSYLGVKCSADGFDNLSVQGHTLLVALNYMASVLCGATSGAETSQTIFKAFGAPEVEKLKSQSDDQKNRTLITLL